MGGALVCRSLVPAVLRSGLGSQAPQLLSTRLERRQVRFALDHREAREGLSRPSLGISCVGSGRSGPTAVKHRPKSWLSPPLLSRQAGQGHRGPGRQLWDPAHPALSGWLRGTRFGNTRISCPGGTWVDMGFGGGEEGFGQRNLGLAQVTNVREMLGHVFQARLESKTAGAGSPRGRAEVAPRLREAHWEGPQMVFLRHLFLPRAALSPASERRDLPQVSGSLG